MDHVRPPSLEENGCIHHAHLFACKDRRGRGIFLFVLDRRQKTATDGSLTRHLPLRLGWSWFSLDQQSQATRCPWELLDAPVKQKPTGSQTHISVAHQACNLFEPWPNYLPLAARPRHNLGGDRVVKQSKGMIITWGSEFSLMHSGLKLQCGPKNRNNPLHQLQRDGPHTHSLLNSHYVNWNRLNGEKSTWKTTDVS